MEMRRFALASMTLLLLAAGLTSRPALADMSGDPGFCYVGWVWQNRYGSEEDAEGRITQVQLSGKVLVCPTDLN